MSDSIEVRSTSSASADVSDVELRVTAITRLLFRPELVANPNDRAAAVRGTFIYQRKTPSDAWEDCPRQPLSTLRAGEGYCLELRAAEVLRLFERMTELYKLFEKEGVPIGENRFVRVPSFLEGFADATVDELTSALTTHGDLGVQALIKLLSWASRATNLPEVVRRLAAMQPDILHELSASVKLSELRSLRERWNANDRNDSEEFWQQLLAENSFLLEQLFTFPITVIKGKAYVGGKTLFNDGGQLADFIVSNTVTTNLGLVEIKTPATPLLARPYRDGVYPLGPDVAGGIAQVLTYRDTLRSSIESLSYNSEARLEAWHPQAVVIAGTGSGLRTGAERRSFELQRRQFRDVQLVCFDELHGRLDSLIGLLEATAPDSPASGER
ncbi:MAG: DUF4263 domain-containing protein [Deltaproteobacteria bacterium]|nr:DUF4263 domain-containing protein [Deltaproteobacteria bacterium]